MSNQTFRTMLRYQYILFKQSLYPAQGDVSHVIYEVYTFSLTLFYFTSFPFIPFYLRKFEQQDVTLFIYYVMSFTLSLKKKKKTHKNIQFYTFYFGSKLFMIINYNTFGEYLLTIVHLLLMLNYTRQYDNDIMKICFIYFSKLYKTINNLNKT